MTAPAPAPPALDRHLVTIKMRAVSFSPPFCKYGRTSLLARISINPNICFGQPDIVAFWVSLILDLLAEGETPTQILKEYPGLQDAYTYVMPRLRRRNLSRAVRRNLN